MKMLDIKRCCHSLAQESKKGGRVSRTTALRKRNARPNFNIAYKMLLLYSK